MRTKMILCTAAALILGSTAIASAQGGMTGSQRRFQRVSACR
jgi:hypothetical protein